MLTFQQIYTAPTPEFDLAWALYIEAFPAEERRSKDQQKRLLHHPAYTFNAIYKEQEVIGMSGVWQLAGFTFLEHLAIDKRHRGQGLGKTIITALQEQTLVPIILEVEPITTHLSQRRIDFYQRLGFALNLYAYRQPPYSAHKPWVALQVMSFPRPLTEKEFELIKAHLYQTVYSMG